MNELTPDRRQKSPPTVTRNGTGFFRAGPILSTPERRGAAILIVLALLVIVGAAIGLALKSTVDARLESRRAEARLQAEFLASAGFELASAQLHAEHDYTGEVWRIPAEQFAGRGAALVEIQVAADSAGRTMTVVAEFPTGESRRQHRHRIVRPWKPPVTESATP